MHRHFLIPILILGFVINLSVETRGQQTVGLFVKSPQAQEGFVLFSPTGYTQTYLIDKCGKEINSWTSNFSPGQSTYLMNDGSLIRPGRLGNPAFGVAGAGGRIERKTWADSLTWFFIYSDSLKQQHHDIKPMPNGNILLLAREKKSMAEAIAQGRNPASISGGEIWSEKIVEIEPVGLNGGIVVWEWDVWDHLVQDFDSTKPNFGVVSEHPELLDLNYLGTSGALPDWLHANSIDYNPELDQVSINFRSLNEFFVIDHSTTTAEAAGHSGGNQGQGGDLLFRWGNPMVYQRGDSSDQVFFAQHDARWIPAGYPGAGKISVYNNGVGRSSGEYSSIDLIQPPVSINGAYSISAGQPFGPQNLDWTYTSSPPIDFYSTNISGAHRLSNGNTIICQGQGGRFFEVDDAGTIHWEYLNPVSASGPVSQGSPQGIANVFKVNHYDAGFPGFAGKDLSPGEPLELNPTPGICDTIASVIQFPLSFPETISWYYHDDILSIQNPDGSEIKGFLMDFSGKILHTISDSKTWFDLDLAGISRQVLTLVLIDPNSSKKMSITFMK